MEYRPVGSTDLKVSVLGFGCAPVGSRAGFAESKRALTLAFDNGVTYFDTADMYGVGGSEQTLARVFAGKRDRIVISTKCGYTFSSRLKALAWVKPLVRPFVTRLKGLKASAAAVMTSQRSQSFEPAYIEQSVHGSLQRLATDRIDLFFLHDPSAEVVARAEVFETLRRLKQAGKIRHVGVSCDPDVALAVLRAPGSGVAAVQVNANLIEQEALATLLPLARAQGIGFVARQPFAHGRLIESGAVRGRLAAAGLPSDSATVSALGLRFLRDTAGVSSILPSMMRPAHLHANVAAMAAGPLTEQERSIAAALGAPAKGARADAC